MEAKLVVVGGKANRSEVKLKLPAMIGRGRDADVTVAHATVSRHHCLVYELDGALVVRDNGSLNGTVVDGERVQEAVLRPGQSLTIGPLTFRAEYEHAGSFPDLTAAPAASAADAGAANGEAAARGLSVVDVSHAAPLAQAAPTTGQHTVQVPAAIGEGRENPKSAPTPAAVDEPPSDNFDFLDEDHEASESSIAPSFGFLDDSDDEPAPRSAVPMPKPALASDAQDEELFRLADEPLADGKSDDKPKRRDKPAANGEMAKPADEPLKIKAPKGGEAESAESADDAALDDFLNSLGLDE